MPACKRLTALWLAAEFLQANYEENDRLGRDLQTLGHHGHG
jgi:hypothetical protein